MSDKIPAPDVGWHLDVPTDDYRRFDAISTGRIHDIAGEDGSPHRCHHFQENPEDRSQTAAMKQGSLFHTLLLEPQLFDARYAIKAKGKGSVAANAAMAELGVEMVDEDQVDRLARAVRFVKGHPQSKKVFEHEDAVFESTIIGHFYYGEEPGERALVKVRPDIILPGPKMAIDVKSRDGAVSKDAAEREAFGWGVQATMTLEAAKSAGVPIEHYCIMFCQTKPPFESPLYQLDFGTIELANLHCEHAIKLHEECRAADHWPRAGEEGLVSIAAKHWDFQKYGERYA